MRLAFKTLHMRDPIGERSFFSTRVKEAHRSGNHVLCSMAHLVCVFVKMMGWAEAAVLRMLRVDSLSPFDSGWSGDSRSLFTPHFPIETGMLKRSALRMREILTGSHGPGARPSRSKGGGREFPHGRLLEKV